MLVIAATFAIATFPALSIKVPLVVAADEWEALPSSSSGSATLAQPASALHRPARSRTLPRPATRPASPATGGAGEIVACGERAVPASEKIQGIVSQINSTWNSNVQVYQSVAAEGPHAIAGGCIFYNPAALAVLLGLRLNLNDPNVLTPMLYAIFAHEVGHEVHRDFDQSRAGVPTSRLSKFS